MKTKSNGKTPPMVVKLLKKAVAEKSQSAVARETGLTLLSVQEYLKGIAEPREKNLKKLAAYFDVSVDFLREGNIYELKAALKLLEIYVDFLGSLTEDQKGPAMMFSESWFTAIYHHLNMYFKTEPDTVYGSTSKMIDSYRDSCIEIKNDFEKWLFETGGLLGSWNPQEQDISIQADNVRTVDDSGQDNKPKPKTASKKAKP